ncbi:MAG: DUF4202 domain-containing protein [Nitrospiria bacterium]
MIQSQQFKDTIARIDAVNSQDPNQAFFDGKAVPKEILYAERMTKWLAHLSPEASEAIQLAARSQHIARWKIPRSDYPMDRKGYHRWRTTLNRFHADTAADILRDVGYDKDTIARVSNLLLKKGLKSNPEMQILEDVICLVFLESYFADFSKKHDEAKLIPIVRKTWKKMTPRGHEAALGLDLSPEAKALIEKALHEE